MTVSLAEAYPTQKWESLSDTPSRMWWHTWRPGGCLPQTPQHDKGQAVAKKKKSGKFKPGTFVARDLYMSRAYFELSGFGPQLLILFLAKRNINKSTMECINLDSITMTFVELENIHNQGRMGHLLPKDGISRPRIIRALDELLAKGFIKIVRRGGAYQKDKSVYALVDDWRDWRPGMVIRVREKETRVRGYLNKGKNQMSRTETLPVHTHGNVTQAAQ